MTNGEREDIRRAAQVVRGRARSIVAAFLGRGIMVYVILYSATMEGLIDAVNSAILSGWECQGGVHALHREMEEAYEYYQAMVKREEQSNGR